MKLLGNYWNNREVANKIIFIYYAVFMLQEITIISAMLYLNMLDWPFYFISFYLLKMFNKLAMRNRLNDTVV